LRQEKEKPEKTGYSLPIKNAAGKETHPKLMKYIESGGFITQLRDFRNKLEPIMAATKDKP